MRPAWSSMRPPSPRTSSASAANSRRSTPSSTPWSPSTAPAIAGRSATERMTLRVQLLLIAALVLALPLSGWQFARQVEQTLRAGHAQALETSARTVARQLASIDTIDEIDWPRINGPGLFVHQPDSVPILDGYADDWAAFVSAEARTPSSPVQALAAETGQTLHLLFEVDSDSQIYSRPGLRDGDQLILEFQSANQG